jgi:hypothetical protein
VRKKYFLTSEQFAIISFLDAGIFSFLYFAERMMCARNCDRTLCINPPFTHGIAWFAALVRVLFPRIKNSWYARCINNCLRFRYLQETSVTGRLGDMIFITGWTRLDRKSRYRLVIYLSEWPSFRFLPTRQFPSASALRPLPYLHCLSKPDSNDGRVA